MCYRECNKKHSRRNHLFKRRKNSPQGGGQFCKILQRKKCSKHKLQLICKFNESVVENVEDLKDIRLRIKKNCDRRYITKHVIEFIYKAHDKFKY